MYIYINLHAIIRGWPKSVIATIEQETNKKRQEKTPQGNNNNNNKTPNNSKEKYPHLFSRNNVLQSAQLLCRISFLLPIPHAKKKTPKPKNHKLFNEVCGVFYWGPCEITIFCLIIWPLFASRLERFFQRRKPNVIHG